MDSSNCLIAAFGDMDSSNCLIADAFAFGDVRTTEKSASSSASSSLEDTVGEGRLQLLPFGDRASTSERSEQDRSKLARSAFGLKHESPAFGDSKLPIRPEQLLKVDVGDESSWKMPCFQRPRRSGLFGARRTPLPCCFPALKPPS